MTYDSPPDEAIDWFDELYADANRDPRAVPWANLEPCPQLPGFLNGRTGSGQAAVVGCGLGDDAEAVAAVGYDTLAFDVSPEAVAWCRERFPATSVDYQVANLLELPAPWHEAYDLVIEVRTVQSLPPSIRTKAIRAVADLVAPGGTALVVALMRPDGTIPTGPPWAVSPSEMSRYLDAGLTLVDDASGGGHSVWELVRTDHE